MQHTTYNVRVMRKQRTSDTSVDITFERLFRNAICLQNLRGTLRYETLNIMVKQTAYSIEPTCNIKYTIYNIRHTAYSIPRTAYNIQYTVYNVRQHIQYTAYSITTYNIQHTAFEWYAYNNTLTAYEWYKFEYYFWKTLICCRFKV